MTTFEERLKELSPARRKKVEARAQQLIAEEMTLQELRKAHRLTQAKMARKLGITQDGISRLEKRSDVLLSTLGDYIQAMGGSLSLVAEFPGQAPIVLSGLAALSGKPPKKPVRRHKPKARGGAAA